MRPLRYDCDFFWQIISPRAITRYAALNAARFARGVAASRASFIYDCHCQKRRAAYSRLKALRNFEFAFDIMKNTFLINARWDLGKIARDISARFRLRPLRRHRPDFIAD